MNILKDPATIDDYLEWPDTHYRLCYREGRLYYTEVPSGYHEIAGYYSMQFIGTELSAHLPNGIEDILFMGSTSNYIILYLFIYFSYYYRIFTYVKRATVW